MGVAELVQPGGGISQHSLLDGLPAPADDHPQYVLLAGRAGGQAVFGGTAVSEELILRGTTNANLGLVRLRSPIIFDDVTAANALQPYSVQDASTGSFTGAFVGGTYSDQRTVSTTSTVFIYEVLRGAPNITKNANDGFSAFTLFQALPTLISGTGAGHNPLNAIVLNAGPTTQHLNTGTRTANNIIGTQFTPQLNTRFSNGQTLNAVAITGLLVKPVYNTNAGTTVSFGTVRGMWMQNLGIPIFGSGAGVETMTAHIGLDVNNIAFGGNVTKAAVRSAQLAASNAYFLLQTGTAKSFFNGDVQIGLDTVGLILGFAQDIRLNWNGAAYEWDPVIGPDLRWTSLAADYWVLSGSAALQGMQFDLQTVSFGTVAPDPSTANYFVRYTGADGRQPTSAGVYSDVYWTSGGQVDVNGLAMTEINSFRIDAITTVLNGGTVADQSGLFIAGMGFPGSGAATRLQSLRITGRSRFDGVMNYNEATLAQLTASVAALALPVTNAGRFVLLEDADALGPWTIQGIVNVQPGDSLYIINTGANAFLLGHQDAAAAAADRIISPTGANLTLGTDEMAKLWYDPVATRWRILETTGA